MIEKVIDTGDTGRLRIQDKTDGPDKVVELWVQSLSPVSIPNLPWAYSIDGLRSTWKSFNFLNTTMWQRLGLVFVGTDKKDFVLHLGETGTSQLEGPTDLEIEIYGYIPSEEPPEEPAPEPDPDEPVLPPRLVNIKVGDIWKRAQVYVRVNGVWKRASPWVYGVDGWKEIV